jgi:hypothetical protein
MREIKLRIERNIMRHEFDVQVYEDGEWHLMERMTPDKLHNLARTLVNEAMESLP